MKRNLPTMPGRNFLVLSALFLFNLTFGQTTVFSDAFATSAGTSYSTANGAVGTSSTWSHTRSGTDFGSRIDAGLLNLTNNATAAYNNYGWDLAATSTAAFATPYSTVLASNPGMITWTFNMRQSGSNPSGFTTGTYGNAFILAGTTGTTNATGTGYAVTLGNSGKTDPIRLVRYNSGLASSTALITSTTSGLTDFGNQYLSVKVTYTPSTNTWQLFVRNDGTTLVDPNTGSLTSQGTVVNNTYTGSTLGIMGGYLNSSLTSMTSYFDNVKVTVVVPITTSLTPSSAIAGTSAFMLTVNGSNFVSGTSLVKWNGSTRTTTFISATQLTASITAADIAAAGSASITVANGAAISNAQTFTIDSPGIPVLTLSTTALNNFSTTTGTASAAATYTISGVNLTADPVITPPANFEVSTNGSTYFASLTLARTGNNITGQPLTIYTRVKSSAAPGIYSGNTTHATTGAVTKNVALSATVLATTPTIASTAVSFTTVTSTGFRINWTNGNGSNRLVVLRQGSTVNAAPVNANTYYTDTNFGNGAQIGTGNYVVYSGTSNTVTVSNLQPATAYYVSVYEFNGSGGIENYLTTTPATGNRTTINSPVGWQIYTANTVNTITFDTTVDGVNNNQFQGEGLEPIAEDGDLSSNAFAFTGFSDGAVAFGGSAAADSDYDRGVSTDSAPLGGLYSFETSTDNSSLGIQPATGDFAPGTTTLRFQNQTGSTITSLNIAYKVYVYNDTAASSSFNFSYSADNSSYTAITGLNIASAATAETNPGWKAYYRVVTITGLTLTNNNYYYLRWTGAAISGSGSFDAFGLDDITMVVNPTNTFVPLNGTAESLTVQGNTIQNGNLTINNDVTLNGGKLDINGNTLFLNGSIINTTTQGIKSSPASSLILGGASNVTLSIDQTTPGTTNAFNAFSINTTASNTVIVSNPIIVNGTLTTAAGQTLNLGTNALTGTLTTITNNGNILIQNTTVTPFPSGKTWGGSGVLNLNASTQQTIVAGTYQNLTVNNTAGAVAATSFTVNGILNLPVANPSATVGSLSMGTFTLTMGGSSTNAGIGDVVGIVTRNTIVASTLYTFGNTYTSILFPNNGTLPTSMSLKIAIGTAPTWRTGAINRTYDFIQTGGSATKAVIQAHYLDSELNGNVESKLVDWAYIVGSATTLEQGRSNFNSTDNWVQLTNVNVGLYFSSSFGNVLLTLDESAAGVLTWNGSASDSWTTAVNWTPNATPSDNTAVFIPNAATTPNDPLLNPLVLLGSVTIEAGGILNAPANSQFTLNSGAGAWLNSGTYNPGTGTSTVIFANADATIAGINNFNNLTINTGAVLRPLTDSYMTIAGTFTNNGALAAGTIENTIEFTGTGQNVPLPNSTVASYHNLIISGTGSVFPASVNVMGNLTFNQPVDFTGKTLVMIGTEPQLINGTASPAFNNLTINNSFGGVTLANNTSVTGTLTLTSGLLNIGSTTLTLGSNAVSGSFDATKMIVLNSNGQVRRSFTATGSYTFPIGESTGTMEYSPVTVAVTAGSFSGAYVGASVTDGIHPDNHSMENNISRYWNVTQSGITGAVATVTANYTAADLLGTETDIAAAQLKGTFDQQANSWIKFAASSSNTLTATGAVLTAGQTNAFTGIKGGIFTATVSGYGSFCQLDAVSLLATPTAGDMPYTYSWSNGLGTNASATPPTSSVGSVNYTVTIKDSNGITATDTATVEVVAPSNGGTLAGSQSICANSTAADLTLSGYTGTILYWQSASDTAFTSPINLSNTTNVMTGAALGLISTTTYYRVVIKSGSCPETYSSTAAITIQDTIWNGSAWTSGVPTSTTQAIISGNLTIAQNITACSMNVTNNAIVSVSSGYSVTLGGSLIVDSGSSFTIENNSALLQSSNAGNAGAITLKRNSSALLRQDYTLWSSPVIGQNLAAFSPETLSNRFYTYSPASDIYTAIAPSNNFNAAQGYLIRMPNTTSGITPTIYPGVFTGVPHNGDYPVTMSNTYNLTGNPYPSPISMSAFVAANTASITGTLYFWRETNNNTLNNAYCAWAGGTFTSNGEAQVFNPNGVIETGQGFFVAAKPGQTALIFNNAQRVANFGNQFFRNANEEERSTVWINVTNTSGAFAQMAVGYITDATQGVDLFDGKAFSDGQFALNSILDTSDYVIQGRALPFVATDVVPLRFKTATPGNYTIAIDHVIGLFTGSQDVYLKDNMNNITHNLTAGAYNFASESGTFDSRFEIVYQSQLGIDEPIFDESDVVVYKQQQQIVINSGNVIMSKVQVYDIRGRLLIDRKEINASEVRLIATEVNQVLIVKITDLENNTVAKKIVY
jgi:hypothetical protein